MKRSTGIFLIPILFLFIACGDEKKSNSFTISTTSDTYSVVEGMKKDIKIVSDREDVTFSILSQSKDMQIEINSGVLEYRAPEIATEKVEAIDVVAISENKNRSNTLTLDFKTVSKNINPSVKVLKTGADDGGFGEDRLFTQSGGDVIDPFDNTWAEQSDGKLAEMQTYNNASLKCKVLGLVQDKNWRLPTLDETLNLIDYSKTPGKSMLEDAFLDHSLVYTWVQQVKDNNIIISFNSALETTVSPFGLGQQNYTSRCIDAPLSEKEHIISTDRYSTYTHDFSTGLQWSPITDESLRPDANESVEQYCANYKGESGWRVPNINELRSIVEGNSVSTFIRKNATTLVSSTPYNDTNVSARKTNYVMYLRENGTIGFGREYVDTVFGITCVKNRD